MIFTPSGTYAARLRTECANLSADEAHAAHDLALYAMNTGDLYRERTLPLIAHVARRVRKGLPTTLGPWQALVLRAARMYAAEMGSNPLHRVPAWRRDAIADAAAFDLIAHYQEQIAETLNGD